VPSEHDDYNSFHQWTYTVKLYQWTPDYPESVVGHNLDTQTFRGASTPAIINRGSWDPPGGISTFVGGKIASSTWGVLDHNAILHQFQYSLTLHCANKTLFFLRPWNFILIQAVQATFRALIVNLKSVSLHYPQFASIIFSFLLETYAHEKKDFELCLLVSDSAQYSIVRWISIWSPFSLWTGRNTVDWNQNHSWLRICWCSWRVVFSKLAVSSDPILCCFRLSVKWEVIGFQGGANHTNGLRIAVLNPHHTFSNLSNSPIFREVGLAVRVRVRIRVRWN